MTRARLALALIGAALLLTACVPAATTTSVDREPASGCPGPDAIPMVVTVLADDAQTSIDLSYPTFEADGSVTIVEEKVDGPVVVRTGYPCGDAADALWVVSATSRTRSHLSCVLSYGGATIATQERFHEGMLDTINVLCQGHRPVA